MQLIKHNCVASRWGIELSAVHTNGRYINVGPCGHSRIPVATFILSNAICISNTKGQRLDLVLVVLSFMFRCVPLLWI